VPGCPVDVLECSEYVVGVHKFRLGVDEQTDETKWDLQDSFRMIALQGNEDMT
jgi:hypothetical protein